MAFNKELQKLRSKIHNGAKFYYCFQKISKDAAKFVLVDFIHSNQSVILVKSDFSYEEQNKNQFDVCVVPMRATLFFTYGFTDIIF